MINEGGPAAVTGPKIREFNELLYRVSRFDKPHEQMTEDEPCEQTMENIYTENRPTYLLPYKEHTGQYINHYVRTNKSNKEVVKVYIHTFKPSEALRLVDIGDVATLNWIMDASTEKERESLGTSFKIVPNGSSVLRHSEAETKVKNDESLVAICRLSALYGFDGYYVAAPGLHPEVGICPGAFGKLTLIDSEAQSVPRVVRATRKANINPAMPPPLSIGNLGTNPAATSPKPNRTARRLFGGRRRRTRRHPRRTHKAARKYKK
jgi:hypothetical protein